MGKLYYITGRDTQMRESVYGVILQWSQVQQMQPLQLWSAEGATAQSATANVAEPATDPTEPPAPNFYLYNYLAHGTRDGLAQLTETYGEEVVEPIYLRSDDETETELLETGIYQSYAPQTDSSTDFQTVMQELVETVFTGYQKISYDFAAALQQLQKDNTPQTQAQANENAPAQSEKKPGKLFRNPLHRAAFLTAWLLVVCLLTVSIYNAVSNPKPNGDLVHVTAQSPEKIQISQPNIDRTDETRFAKPVSYSDLDIFPEIQTNQYTNATCVVYDNGDICYIPGPTSRYEKSQDRQIAILLTRDLTLWQIDETGTRIVFPDVSDFSFAGNGSYLYFICEGNLFGYDTATEIVELLVVPTTMMSLVASSPNGNYCVYTESATQFHVWNKETDSTITTAPDTKLSSVAAVSDDGQWVYGYSPEDGFVRIHTTDGALTPLSAAGDFIPKLYFNADATELYYEYEGALYFSDHTGVKTKFLDSTGLGWRLLLQQSTDLYTRENLYVQNLYFYNDSFDNQFVRVGNTLHQLIRVKLGETTEPLLILYEAAPAWIDETCLITQNNTQLTHHKQDANGIITTIDLPAEILNNQAQILSCSADTLFYIDSEQKLHGYAIDDQKELIMLDFNRIGYAFSKDDTEFFYMYSDHIIQGYSMQNASKVIISDFAHIPENDADELFLHARDSGVYLYDSSGQSGTGLYRISTEEPYVTYVGSMT